VTDGAVLAVDEGAVFDDEGIDLDIAQIEGLAGAEIRGHQVAHVGEDTVGRDHLGGGVVGADVIAVGIGEDHIIQDDAAADSVGLDQAALHVVKRGGLVLINTHHAEVLNPGVAARKCDGPARGPDRVGARTGRPEINDRQGAVAFARPVADGLSRRDGQRGVLKIDLSPLELIDAVRAETPADRVRGNLHIDHEGRTAVRRGDRNHRLLGEKRRGTAEKRDCQNRNNSEAHVFLL